MFEKVKRFIDPDDLSLVERTIERYKTIPVNELPQSLVHGDFTKTNILKADDGKVYVLDFSAANYYPRIQELAIIAANLLHDNVTALQDRCKKVFNEYSQFVELTEQERKHLPVYALAGVAMEFMGAHQEKYLNGNNTEETEYWLNLGRTGLHDSLLK